MYDITFYFVFNILFLQMIYGIIIDTFAQLREQRKKLIEEIEQKCFICGLDKGFIADKYFISYQVQKRLALPHLPRA